MRPLSLPATETSRALRKFPIKAERGNCSWCLETCVQKHKYEVTHLSAGSVGSFLCHTWSKLMTTSQSERVRRVVQLRRRPVERGGGVSEKLGCVLDFAVSLQEPHPIMNLPPATTRETRSCNVCIIVCGNSFEGPMLNDIRHQTTRHALRQGTPARGKPMRGACACRYSKFDEGEFRPSLPI